MLEPAQAFNKNDMPIRDQILRVIQVKEQTLSFRDRVSSIHDLLSARSDTPVRRAGLDLLDARAEEIVLDIGFGGGESLVALAKAVGPKGMVFGIELSAEMVELARKNLAKASLLERARLRRGNAIRLPYQNETMDAVFVSFTLEQFDTSGIQKVLHECKRVLCPGGRIVVVSVSQNTKGRSLLGVLRWAHELLPNLPNCRPILVQPALERAGFNITTALKRPRWIPVEITLGFKQ